MRVSCGLLTSVHAPFDVVRCEWADTVGRGEEEAGDADSHSGGGGVQCSVPGAVRVAYGLGTGALQQENGARARDGAERRGPDVAEPGDEGQLRLLG